MLSLPRHGSKFVMIKRIFPLPMEKLCTFQTNSSFATCGPETSGRMFKNVLRIMQIELLICSLKIFTEKNRKRKARIGNWWFNWNIIQIYWFGKPVLCRTEFSKKLRLLENVVNPLWQTSVRLFAISDSWVFLCVFYRIQRSSIFCTKRQNDWASLLQNFTEIHGRSDFEKLSILSCLKRR